MQFYGFNNNHFYFSNKLVRTVGGILSRNPGKKSDNKFFKKHYNYDING